MNSRYFIYIFFTVILISSCRSSKKTISQKDNNDEQLKMKINELNLENQQLKELIIGLENKVSTLEKERDNTINDIIPQLQLEVNESISISQIEDFEKFIYNNSALSSKYNKFKKGGIEGYLNVSYTDMDKVISHAKSYLGSPHVMGGLTKSGIDCSGLLYVSFNSAGIKTVPRIAQDFARLGYVIMNINDLKKGDLVFFTGTYSTSKLITHAGICTGNGSFIHTSSSKGVIISKVNDPYYWREKFLFGTRIIN